MCSNITYDSLRIAVLSPGDTVVLASLTMTTDQDTSLTVQGLRTAIRDWVNVPGTWTLSANLKSDTAAPTSQATWRFSPTDTGKGTITVTFGGHTAIIPVTILPGSPRSLVLYPSEGAPSAANKAYPHDTTVVAGVNFPLVAAMFDQNSVWLSAYETVDSLKNLITWTVSDPTVGTLAPLTGDEAVFMSTKSQHSVSIVATYRKGPASYADTVHLTVLPGPATQLVIEANKDINLSPNAADPVDSITINAGETTRSVYAMLRDAYGNWVAYSQVTVWTSFNPSVATAAGGVAIQGEGIVTRTTDSGVTYVSALNTDPAYASLHLADTIKVIMANIFYRALRIVVRDSTQISSLSMNTNQDTTLKVQGLRSDNGQWEYVSASWGMLAGLSTDPMPPGQAQQWSFSPVTPGTGWVRVYMDNDSTLPDTVLVNFTVGPPTKVDISIITPADSLIAGDTIRALVRIQNSDGLVPGPWCYSGAGGAIYQDGLATGEANILRPLCRRQRGRTAQSGALDNTNTTDECFENGIDTIKFVLYYAPYKSDSSHQIFVTSAGSREHGAVYTSPGQLDSLALEDVNRRARARHHHSAPIRMETRPLSPSVTTSFGNKIGPGKQQLDVLKFLHLRANALPVFPESSTKPGSYQERKRMAHGYRGR